MVIQTIMNKHDLSGMYITYSFVDEASGQKIAEATNNVGSYVKLYTAGKEIIFVGKPAFVERFDLRLPYEETLRKKNAIGFKITCDEAVIAHFYGSAMTCGRKGIFKRNIGLTVFAYEGNAYPMVRVGFLRERVHYYCVLTEDGSTVAIIERHSGDNSDSKATIYVEEEKYVLLALIACVEEIVWNSVSGDMESRMDTSAGPYISRYKEEQALLDRAFLERAKENLTI